MCMRNEGLAITLTLVYLFDYFPRASSLLYNKRIFLEYFVNRLPIILTLQTPN